MKKPYIDHKISKHVWIRTFDGENSSSEEYVWHRDKHDRSIKVLDCGSGWKLQLDNELPISINKNNMFFIPRMIYHRLIPGEKELKIEIKEDTNDSLV